MNSKNIDKILRDLQNAESLKINYERDINKLSIAEDNTIVE